MKITERRGRIRKNAVLVVGRIAGTALLCAGIFAGCIFGQDQEPDARSKDSLSKPRAAGAVVLDGSWTYAPQSVIHTGAAELYLAGGAVREEAAQENGAENVQKNNGEAAQGNGVVRRDITVCVNAGHGTLGGSSAQTLSHPDGTPKVTGGTTAEGAVYSTAISSGTTFLDGTTEAEANLKVAMALKELLLADGYDVLMIRESEDVQLDNVARTVIANNCADIHVAIHFDSTESNKGCFYCSVPDVPSYKAMEPVASHWEAHDSLGRSLVEGLKSVGVPGYGEGSIQMDLTQTSYSTIPSMDIEVGDRASDHSPEACERYAQGLKAGIDEFVRTGAAYLFAETEITSP